MYARGHERVIIEGHDLECLLAYLPQGCQVARLPGYPFHALLLLRQICTACAYLMFSSVSVPKLEKVVDHS